MMIYVSKEVPFFTKNSIESINEMGGSGKV
jgi:hypothetical protein